MLHFSQLHRAVIYKEDVMEQVILIDDEINIRRLVKYLIHWEEIGIHLAGEFDDALEAVEFTRKNHVDIIVSDIMMPELDGLEMVDRIRQFSPDCKFVMISGYRDFEFAQKAVKLGVKDYLLKPVNEKELNDVLQDIVDGLRQNHKASGKDVPYRQKIASLLTGAQVFRDIPGINEKYHTFFEGEGAFRVLHIGFCNYNEQNISQTAEYLLDKLISSVKNNCTDLEAVQISEIRYDVLMQVKPGMDETVLRCLDTTYKEAVREYRNIQSLRFYVSLGVAVKSPEGIRDSADSAHFFLSGRLGYGSTRLYVADALPNAEKLLRENYSLNYQDARAFDRYIDSADEAGIKNMIRKLFRELLELEDNYIFYFYLSFDLNERMCAILKQRGIERSQTDRLEEKLRRILDNCDTVRMIQHEMERFCCDNVNKYLTDQKDSMQVYVQFAKNYIEKHYAEEVTLQIIADKAHINSAYLSSIFKKNMGVNYQNYLTEVRIEKAKTLLCDLDMNLTQIANAVGYNSTRYFSKTFEQETGIKPSEYRCANLRKSRYE